MLNLKNIAAKYGFKYGFNTLPEVGEGDSYYDKSYNLTYPIIAIVVVVMFLIYYKKKRNSKEV